VAQPHAVRRIRFRAGPGRPATRGRSAAVQRLQDTVERECRCAHRHVDLRGRPLHRRRLHVARRSHQRVLVPHLPRPRRPQPGGQLLQQLDHPRWRARHVQGSGLREPTGLRPRRAVDPGGHDQERSDRRGSLPGHKRRHLLLRRPRVRHADPRTESEHRQDRRHAQANQGDVVTYTVTVTNPQRPEGQTPTDVATNVVVSDPIPSGLDFVDFVVNPTFPPPARRSPRAPTAPLRSASLARPASHSRPTPRSPTASARA
jgi:uncharacterized repeat protein (TIGR01451 family)